MSNLTPGAKYTDVDMQRYKFTKINNMSKIYTTNPLRETNEKERLAVLPSP